MKELAREAGRAVKTYTVVTLIQGQSDAHARELLDYYQSGADTEALRNIIAMVNGTTGELVQDIAKKFVIFGPQPLVGGPETGCLGRELAGAGGRFRGLDVLLSRFHQRPERFPGAGRSDTEREISHTLESRSRALDQQERAGFPKRLPASAHDFRKTPDARETRLGIVHALKVAAFLCSKC